MMNRSRNSVYQLGALLVLTGFLTAGCDRDNNPLFGNPPAGTNGITLSIPQIDTKSPPHNRVFLSIVDSVTRAPVGQNIELGNISLQEGLEPTVPYEFGVITEPIYLVLVIDRSGSMGEGTGSRTDFANQAAANFVNSLGPNDFAAVVDFEAEVTLKTGFTNDKSFLITNLSTSANGGTAFYDAVGIGADIVQDAPGRRLLVILTDGQDTASTGSVATAVSAVNARGLSAYPVGMGSSLPAAAMTDIDTIANLTSGFSSYSPTGSVSEITSIFLSILNRFENLYYVKYRRRSKGDVNVFLTYGGFTATASKPLD